MSLEQRHVLVGVSAGIAAYKACELVRQLRKAGAAVCVVMTDNASRFVGSATFQALSGNPVHTSLWDTTPALGMGHLELARWADQIVVAPASADVLARLAQGRADDLLATLCLASTASLTVAPAMNHRMWEHAATRENVARLRQHGAQVLEPDTGELAEGESGPGRLPEPERIVAALADAAATGPLAGVPVLVSAGPTYEAIDPVRFIGNRSSGRMGFAVAAAAVAAGARVTLVAGPVALATPEGVAERIDVRSAADMHTAVIDAAVDNAIYISAAAVGDYRPRESASHKLKKRDADAAPSLELQETPDILAAVTALAEAPFVVGFAAETDDVAAGARDKLQHKQLDMIAANRVGADAGFDRDDNALTLYWPGGEKDLGHGDKAVLARALVACVAERYAGDDA